MTTFILSRKKISGYRVSDMYAWLMSYCGEPGSKTWMWGNSAISNYFYIVNDEDATAFKLKFEL